MVPSIRRTTRTPAKDPARRRGGRAMGGAAAGVFRARTTRGTVEMEIGTHGGGAGEVVPGAGTIRGREGGTRGKESGGAEGGELKVG